MKLKHNVKENTVNVLNLNSVVQMANVFRRDGGAIMKTVIIALSIALFTAFSSLI